MAMYKVCFAAYTTITVEADSDAEAIEHAQNRMVDNPDEAVWEFIELLGGEEEE